MIRRTSIPRDMPPIFHMIPGGHYEPWRNRPSSLYAYERLPTIADHWHFPSDRWQEALLLKDMFARAMVDGDPSPDDRAKARVIGDVWLSNLVAWVTRRASANDVINHLELATRLLLR